MKPNTTTMLSDAQFMEQLETYRDEFYAFIYRKLNDKSLAEDIFSEAVLAAYSSLPKFKAGSNFRAWMYRILLNKVYVANRKRAREMPALLDRLAEQAAPEAPRGYMYDSNFTEEISDELVDALQALHPGYRDCFLMRVFEGRSYKEIAEKLNIPVGTVMTNLSRARKKLKAHLVGSSQPTPA